MTMGLRDSLREHVSEHRYGMVYDLAFAVGWVTVVTVVHGLLQGPEWAYYLLLLTGIPTYFLFHASLSVATAER